MIADGLTKALIHAKFHTFVEQMQMTEEDQHSHKPRAKRKHKPHLWSHSLPNLQPTASLSDSSKNEIKIDSLAWAILT